MTTYAPYIATRSGVHFEFLAPRPEQIHLEDIGHALAHTCRFSGHTRDFYSVAEHSVRVSLACAPADALWGLLHDASEAYLNDIPRPIKQYLPQYKALEGIVQRAVAHRFGLLDQMPESVHRADEALLATEARDLDIPGWETWPLTEPPLVERIVPMSPKEARLAFFQRYYEITRSRRVAP